MTDKSMFYDTGGAPLTQSLFLEMGYKTEYALYTLKSYDHTYKGKVYPSLKRLYLETEDPTEYEFAVKYLIDWAHWKRLNANKALSAHFEEWREELELKIRSQAVKDMMSLCASENGNFSAAKFLADRGWDKRAAGRPSKSEKEKEQRMSDRLMDEFHADVRRLELVTGDKR